MKYRKFGLLEWGASILGLGTAALPLRERKSELFGTTQSIETIRYAIDRGVNYLDLGYPYDLQEQERIASVVREALQGGYRHKVRIAVTLPSSLIHSMYDLDLYLDRQLEWLQTDRASFCLFGRLNRENWLLLQELEALSWAEEAIEEGRIDAVGFAFHDHFQVLKHILAAYDRWALCQFQFSFMDIDQDPGISGIKYAAEKGLAVVVTEPLKNGRLIKKPPCPVAAIWKDALEGSSPAEWGLRFIWNYPEVTAAVRDAGSVDEVAESAAVADGTVPDSLTVQEEVLLGQVRDAYKKLRRIPCSSCRPCMPCPEGIDVPRIFELFNDAFMYEDVKTARTLYRKERHHAGRCNQCRACEERCTRKLDIVGWLEQAHELFAGCE